jgi:enediyne biosynthesis protein E4
MKQYVARRRPIIGMSAAGLCLVAGLAVLSQSCTTKDTSTGAGPDVVAAQGREGVLKPPSVRFVDITAKSGIRFTHTSGAFGKKLLPETLGSGVAFIDFDKDGHQDLLFVNACWWPGHEDKTKPAPTLALYRNMGDGTFKDVTVQCGLGVTMYGMGVTVGDYDNDGWPDIFVTGLGGCRLFHNEPDGKGGRRFVDVTAAAGDLAVGSGLPAGEILDVEEPIAFPSSAAFLDYNNDGLLDLFVCQYVTWSPKLDLAHGCTLKGAGRAYCPPKVFRGTQCVLYKNLGGGKFKDVSKEAGIHVTGERGEAIGKSLGVAVCDVDGDGWPDIVVANDTVRNFLFHNQRDGTFKERGQEAGVAYAEGAARAGMGIDWAEYRPGKFAVAIGNFADEPITLLRLDRPHSYLFSDVALIEGLYGPSRIVLKFGLFFFDFDLDGLLDFLTCNGHLEPDIKLVEPSQSYKQPVQLWWNTGGKRTFELVGPEFAGPELFQPIVGRGCAFADIDGDGYLDVVVTENGGPARLFKNQGGTGNHWLRLVLEGDGKRTNTSAIGAQVTLTAGGKVQHRFVTSARGYLSQSELPLTFGLGKTDKVDRVEIRWPGVDQVQVLEPPPAVDRVHRVLQR